MSSSAFPSLQVFCKVLNTSVVTTDPAPTEKQASCPSFHQSLWFLSFLFLRGLLIWEGLETFYSRRAATPWLPVRCLIYQKAHVITNYLTRIMCMAKSLYAVCCKFSYMIQTNLPLYFVAIFPLPLWTCAPVICSYKSIETPE